MKVAFGNSEIAELWSMSDDAERVALEDDLSGGHFTAPAISPRMKYFWKAM